MVTDLEEQALDMQKPQSNLATRVKVSILCLSYNQKNYIKRCIDGFLMQETNFNFEILINDDASTDGTKEIIAEYAEKYPKIIKPIFHSDNQYSRGGRGMFIENLFPIAKGQYIALCEGDDYWTDKNKLQQQADFLDTHSDFSLCFHRSKVVFENNEKEDSLFPEDTDPASFTLERLLKENFIQTNSVMYRKQKYSGMLTTVMPQDLYMHLYHARFGKIGFINKVMSVYRRQPEGIWWDSHSGHMSGIYKKHHRALFALYVEELSMFGKNKTHRDIINKHVEHLINELINIDEKEGSSILLDCIENFPTIIENYMKTQRNFIHEQGQELIRLDNNEKTFKEAYEIKNNELLSIKNSRRYKIGSRLAYPLDSIKKHQ